MQACYRPLIMKDKSQLVELFERVPPVIARMSNRLVYKAIIDDALRSKNALIFLAVLDNRLVGYVITAWDWDHFKRTFIQRHPLIGFIALTKRLKKKLNTQDTSVNHRSLEAVDTLPIATNAKQNYSWEDSAKTIGKVIYIGIDPKVRSKGFGTALYSNLIKHLGQNGFTRIDAHIDKDNLRSVNMHKKAGWTVIQNASGFFAFFEIKPERLNSND